MKNEEITAMDCWHFVSALLPINGSNMAQDIYIKTFRAFKLLEEEEKKQKDE